MAETRTLAYAGTGTAPVSTVLFKCAVALGAFPLVVGVSIFGLWLVTHAVALELLGLLWLGIGVLFVIAAAICGYIQAAREYSSACRPRSQIRLRILFLIALFASNFVAAYAIMQAVK